MSEPTKFISMDCVACGADVVAEDGPDIGPDKFFYQCAACGHSPTLLRIGRNKEGQAVLIVWPFGGP